MQSQIWFLYILYQGVDLKFHLMLYSVQGLKLMRYYNYIIWLKITINVKFQGSNLHNNIYDLYKLKFNYYCRLIELAFIIFRRNISHRSLRLIF